MLKSQLIVGSTLLATCVVMAGCNAEQFASINKSFTQFKTASSSFGSATVPAAAIAAATGGMELVKVMSSSSSKIIAAGGGNIIAAGGGNLQNRYAIATVETIADQNGVSDAKVEYESSPLEGRSLKSTIKEFSCVSQGYKITARGSFTYTLTEATGENAYVVFQTGAKGRAQCEVSGEIKYEKTEVKLKKLSFDTQDPLPVPKEKLEIGSFELETTGKGDDYALIKAKAFTQDGGDGKAKISCEGTSKVGQNGPEKPITFDQNNAAGLDAEAGVERSDKK